MNERTREGIASALARYELTDAELRNPLRTAYRMITRLHPMAVAQFKVTDIAEYITGMEGLHPGRCNICQPPTWQETEQNAWLAAADEEEDDRITQEVEDMLGQ